MQRVIGIDFGTSTTYMNVKRYNGSVPDGDKFSYMPVVFNYGGAAGFVASIIRENADGSFDFGAKASEELDGSRIYTDVKMSLESTDETERNEARRITKEFFKHLHETYTQQSASLGSDDDSEETVVSYPVKWQPDTVQFMLDAARTAGFKNVRGMDEATAAVSTVLCQNSGEGKLIYADKPGYLMLIDMGAGTTDLVVCRYIPSADGVRVEPVSSWPRSADQPTFGGREIDTVLEQYVENYLTESAAHPMMTMLAHDAAVKEGEAKKWKEQNVSVSLGKGENVTTCGYISTFRKMLSRDFPAFGREEFEKLIESGLEDYCTLVRGCLEDAAAADSDFREVDLVILTGGHSAWYFARDILSGRLDCPALAPVQSNSYRIISLPNPQSTVSLGLIYSKLPFDIGEGYVEAEEPEDTGDVNGCDGIDDINEEEIGGTGGAAVTPMLEKLNRYYYCEAKKYLRSVSYVIDEATQKYAGKNMTLPKGEEVLFYDFSPHDAVNVYCALTESGMHLKNGIIAPTRHFSWQEFAAVEWGEPNFFTDFKKDVRSLLEYNFQKSHLRGLHTHLHGLSANAAELELEEPDDIAGRDELGMYYSVAAEEYLRGKSLYVSDAAIALAWEHLDMGIGERVIHYAYNPAESGVYCALTDGGVYISSGDKTNKLTWTEFVRMEWKYRFLASDFNRGYKNDARSLLECYFNESEIKEVHDHLLTLPKDIASVRKIRTKEKALETVKPQEKTSVHVPVDRTVCPACGEPLNGKKRCPVCNRVARRELKLPFKMEMSWYTGEKALGVSKATGQFTILEDRIELKRHFGNAAAVLTPYTVVGSAIKSGVAPKDIFRMREISDAKMGKYGFGTPSLVITMTNGDKHTFVPFAVTGGQALKEKVEDALELVLQYKGR